MMLTDLKEWVSSVLAASTYTYAYGMWQETEQTAVSRYCVIQATGGNPPDVDDRRPRFRVILLGRRGDRGDSQQVMADAEALMQASLGDSAPCGAANVRSIGEPVGPGFTTEDRAWAQVDFEVIY
jgi:hypothetical protein